MFNIEKDGYCKAEVDARFNQMLSEISSLKHNSNHINKLNLALVSALEKAKEIDMSSKNIFRLKIQKIMLIYQTLEKSFNKLLQKFPQIENVSDIKDEFTDFSTNLQEILKDDIKIINNLNTPVKTDNDTIRLLLNKMSAYSKPAPQQEKKQTTIKRTDSKENYIHDLKPNESGFDLHEAINPKIDLDEIMKAFDFDV